MYGDIAINLLKEIHNKKQLIAYNGDGIRNIISEIDQLVNILNQITRVLEEEKKNPH